MKAYYNIYLTIDDVRVWMNKYTSKLSYSFSNNLCSTAWKSVTDTASVKLVFNDRNVAELSEIISALIDAQQSFPPKEIGFEALDESESKTIFKGTLDFGKLSIESAKLPGSVSLTAKSIMDKLDKKPNVNFVLYPAVVQDVVERCILEAGLENIVDWRCSINSKQMEVPFVVTDEDSDTWRDKIDTLLTEMGGCTLAFDHSEDKFYVLKVNDEDRAFSDVPVKYHVQSKLKSSTTKFAKDGVVVSYGNLNKSEDQIIYWHDISLSNEDKLKPKGDIIKPGVYYPFDSDIQKTYEEYETNLLDYGQLIGNTRKANNHIALYYVDPASTKVEIVASDMNGKGVDDWYENATFISPEGGFTYPGGGEFYPRKAWLSFKNKTDNDINITRFSISGDTYYSDAEYRIVMPWDCKDPEEYNSKYIANTDTAKDFANFLMNLKRFGSDTSTWTERWGDHNLGDKVRLMHKGGNIIDAVIVRKESIIYGDELWAKVTAVSTDGWSFEQPSLVQGNAMSTSLLDPYENAKRNGYTGSKEQWESRNDIFYLWSSSETELRPKNRAFWKLGGKWMLFNNLPVGDFGMQDWMNSWSEVIAERTEEYNYLWAKVGEDGEPFLLQGQPAKIFSLSLSSNTFIRDNRRVGENQTITIETQIWGYSGTPKINVSNGTYDEATGVLSIPYNNNYDFITVTASLKDAPIQTARISVIDETEYKKYWGASSSEPTGITVEGDAWFNTSDNLIYRYTAGVWKKLSESGISNEEISEICARAQRDALSIIEAGTLTASDYAYFNTIIAGTITADYISSKDIKSQNFQLGKSGYRLRSEDGRIDAIDARIYGDLASETMSASYAEGFSIDETFSEMSIDGTVEKVIPISSLEGLKINGVYVFNSATFVYDDGSVVNADESTPLVIVKKPYNLGNGKYEDDSSELYFYAVKDIATGIFINILSLFPDNSLKYYRGNSNIKSVKISSPTKSLVVENITPFEPYNSYATDILGERYYGTKTSIGSRGLMFEKIYAFDAIHDTIKCNQTQSGVDITENEYIKKKDVKNGSLTDIFNNPRIVFGNDDFSEIVAMLFSGAGKLQIPDPTSNSQTLIDNTGQAITIAGTNSRIILVINEIRSMKTYGAVFN